MFFQVNILSAGKDVKSAATLMVKKGVKLVDAKILANESL